MHREALQLRLLNYLSKLQLGSTVELEDGYYRLLIQLKVDSKMDVLHVKRVGFDKYLAEATEIEELESEEEPEIESHKPSKSLYEKGYFILDCIYYGVVSIICAITLWYSFYGY